MITAEEAKQYVKKFEPSQEILDYVEGEIKSGNRHIQYWTTRLRRDYSEDVAQYFRDLGYNAQIKDVYNLRTGQRGGNYLKIDL